MSFPLFAGFSATQGLVNEADFLDCLRRPQAIDAQGKICGREP